MSFNRKLFIYFLGLILGVGILNLFTYFKKEKAGSEKTHFFCRSIYERELKSESPLDPFLSLFYNEFASLDASRFRRVLVFDRAGPSGFLRVEEDILIESNKMILLTRLVFLADHFFVILKKNAAVEDFFSYLQNCSFREGVCSLPEGFDYQNRKGVMVKLPSCSIPGYLKYKSDLESCSLVESVERVPVL